MNYLSTQLNEELATKNLMPRTQEMLVPFLKQFTSLNLPLVELISEMRNEEDSHPWCSMDESDWHHGKMWGKVAGMEYPDARLNLLFGGKDGILRKVHVQAMNKLTPYNMHDEAGSPVHTDEVFLRVEWVKADPTGYRYDGYVSGKDCDSVEEAMEYLLKRLKAEGYDLTTGGDDEPPTTAQLSDEFEVLFEDAQVPTGVIKDSFADSRKNGTKIFRFEWMIPNPDGLHGVDHEWKRSIRIGFFPHPEAGHYENVILMFDFHSAEGREIRHPYFTDVNEAMAYIQELLPWGPEGPQGPEGQDDDEGPLMKAINALNLPTHNKLDEDGIREIMPYYMVRTKECSDTSVIIEYYHHDTGLIRQIDIDCYSSIEDTPWCVRNCVVINCYGRTRETEFFYATMEDALKYVMRRLKLSGIRPVGAKRPDNEETAKEFAYTLLNKFYDHKLYVQKEDARVYMKAYMDAHTRSKELSLTSFRYHKDMGAVDFYISHGDEMQCYVGVNNVHEAYAQWRATGELQEEYDGVDFGAIPDMDFSQHREAVNNAKERIKEVAGEVLPDNVNIKFREDRAGDPETPVLVATFWIDGLNDKAVTMHVDFFRYVTWKTDGDIMLSECFVFEPNDKFTSNSFSNYKDRDCIQEAIEGQIRKVSLLKRKSVKFLIEDMLSTDGGDDTKKYMVIDTWNGSGYSTDNGVDIKQFDDKSEAKSWAFQRSLAQANGEASRISEIDSWSYSYEFPDGDSGAYQLRPTTKEDGSPVYGVMILCNVNEVKTLNKEEYYSKIQELDALYGEDLEEYLSVDPNADRFYASYVDEFDYQFRLMENIKSEGDDSSGPVQERIEQTKTAISNLKANMDYKKAVIDPRNQEYLSRLESYLVDLSQLSADTPEGDLPEWPEMESQFEYLSRNLDDAMESIQVFDKKAQGMHYARMDKVRRYVMVRVVSENTLGIQVEETHTGMTCFFDTGKGLPACVSNAIDFVNTMFPDYSVRGLMEEMNSKLALELMGREGKLAGEVFHDRNNYLIEGPIADVTIEAPNPDKFNANNSTPTYVLREHGKYVQGYDYLQFAELIGEVDMMISRQHDKVKRFGLLKEEMSKFVEPEAKINEVIYAGTTAKYIDNINSYIETMVKKDGIFTRARVSATFTHNGEPCYLVEHGYDGPRHTTDIVFNLSEVVKSIDPEGSMTEAQTPYCRVCSVTGEGMNEGWIINDQYFKHQYLAVYEVENELNLPFDGGGWMDDDNYWTEWDSNDINELSVQVNGEWVELSSMHPVDAKDIIGTIRYEDLIYNGDDNGGGSGPSTSPEKGVEKVA